MGTKIDVFGLGGEVVKNIELPEFFKQKIREDIVSKVLESGKTQQPYGPSIVAGKQHSASGKIVHRRHVWRSGYGLGMSRVPRKILSRRGTRFNWVGAEVASTRGGRRAHPPKPVSMIKNKKINKKEMRIALLSALGATANKKIVASRYKSLDEKDIKNLPLIIGSDVVSLKTGDIIKTFKKILDEKLFKVALKDKRVRAGKGKMRGRRYKSNAGILIVTGNKENIRTKALDVKTVQNLSVSHLAQGGLGRLVVYTENAIKELNEKLKESKK